MLADLRTRFDQTYPGAVIRRFLDLELLDKGFGLAAQVFVALLPLLIVLVSAVLRRNGDIIATQLTERFSLQGPADTAVHALFTSSSTVIAISWMAVALSLLSAFSLSRRLSRVYALIFGLPSLTRSQLWRGFVWIVLQISLFVAASGLRGVYRDSGWALSIIAVMGLLLVWFVADAAGLRLLVPSIPMRLLIPSAILSGIGRIGLSAWAAVYMPRTLDEQAVQFGPIGVTFALFTLILAGVFVFLSAPLLVAVWDERRTGIVPPVTDEELVADPG